MVIHRTLDIIYFLSLSLIFFNQGLLEVFEIDNFKRFFNINGNEIYLEEITKFYRLFDKFRTTNVQWKTGSMECLSIDSVIGYFFNCLSCSVSFTPKLGLIFLTYTSYIFSFLYSNSLPFCSWPQRKRWMSTPEKGNIGGF